MKRESVCAVTGAWHCVSMLCYAETNVFQRGNVWLFIYLLYLSKVSEGRERYYRRHDDIQHNNALVTSSLRVKRGWQERRTCVEPSALPAGRSGHTLDLGARRVRESLCFKEHGDEALSDALRDAPPVESRSSLRDPPLLRPRITRNHISPEKKI